MQLNTFKWNFSNLMLRPLFDGPDSLGDFDDGSSDIDILEDGSDDDSTENSEEDSTESDDDVIVSEDDNDENTEPKSEEKPDEEEVDEEEQEEKPDGKEDETDPGKTTVKAVKAKYPTLFKEFPELKAAFFYRQQMAQHFGSIEDAKDAAEKAQNFEQFSESVESGDTGTILDAVAEMGQSVAVKFVDNFLPSLAERNPRLVARVTAPYVKQAIKLVFDEGTRLGENASGKNLKLAAKYVAQHLFGEDDPSKFSGEQQRVSPEQERFEKERADFARQQFNTASRDVTKVLQTRISKDVTKQVDPNGTMNEFMRDALVEKVDKEIQKVLAADKAHVARMTSLWKKATKDGYSSEAKSRIISAYLTRAKQSMPSVVAKVKAQGKVDKKQTPESKGTVPSQSSKSGKSTQSGRVDYRRSSDLDILNDRAKFIGQK